ncbi:MAG: hypothetical protein KAS85_08460 [Rhodobacteraceae bacterium]|nr:hypothetical protein [Paracoccaceae bacterium]
MRNIELPGFDTSTPTAYIYMRIIAPVMIGAWILGSVYAVNLLDATLFQRCGALGVGALMSHYVFIRYTWSERRYYSLVSEIYAISRIMNGKTGDNKYLDDASQDLHKIREEITQLTKSESTSTAFEISFLILATIQWGFGDMFVLKIGGV